MKLTLFFTLRLPTCGSSLSCGRCGGGFEASSSLLSMSKKPFIQNGCRKIVSAVPILFMVLPFRIADENESAEETEGEEMTDSFATRMTSMR